MPLTPRERRHQVAGADPNAGLRLLLDVATGLANALEEAARASPAPEPPAPTPKQPQPTPSKVLGLERVDI